ncbi:helix-turn-helix transcriptional regulator [bacterium]|nr:helix-turn-helix transcriptional regulator [bacterium]
MDRTILVVIGKNIKKYRLKCGLTQEQLAEKVNIHPTYVGKLEAGKNNPSTLTLDAIATSVGVSLEDLVRVRN